MTNQTFYFEVVEDYHNINDLQNMKRFYPNLDVKIASSRVGTAKIEKNYSHKGLYGVTISADIDDSIDGSSPFHYLREDDANRLRAELKTDAEKQFSDFLEEAKTHGLKPIGSIKTASKKEYAEAWIKAHGKFLPWYALGGILGGAIFPFSPYLGAEIIILTPLPVSGFARERHRSWKEDKTRVELEDMNKIADNELRRQFEKAYSQSPITNDMSMKEILFIAKEGLSEGFSILGKKLGITK